MNINKNNSSDSRQCNGCRQNLPATTEFFVKDKSRPLGIAYECRKCHSQRRLGRDTRTDRWANHTPKQRQAAIDRNKRYAQTDKGRAVFLRSAYKQIDACDLTSKEVLALITQPCVHCGTTTERIGLDRIDNALPHIKGNVAPSCAYCNFARGDRFTFDEMQLIGKVIRQVLANRKINGQQDANDSTMPQSPRVQASMGACRI